MTHRQDDQVGLQSVLTLCGLEDHLPRIGKVARLVLAEDTDLDEGELEGRGFDSGHGDESKEKARMEEVGVEVEREGRSSQKGQQAISGFQEFQHLRG